MSEPTNQPEIPPPGAGYPAPPPLPYAGAAPSSIAPRNGLGIAALILAIVGLLMCWSIIGGVILGIAAVVLGFVARGRVKRGEANNGGVAIAGVVLGFVSILAALAFIPIWMKFFADVGFGNYYDCMTKAGQDQSAQQHCADQFTQTVESKLSVTLTPAP